MKFRTLPRPVGLLKLMLHLFCTIFKGENSADLIFIKYTVNIVLCWDTSVSICFKLGMMLHMAKLYSLIPV